MSKKIQEMVKFPILRILYPLELPMELILKLGSSLKGWIVFNATDQRVTQKGTPVMPTWLNHMPRQCVTGLSY